MLSEHGGDTYLQDLLPPSPRNSCSGSEMSPTRIAGARHSGPGTDQLLFSLYCEEAAQEVQMSVRPSLDTVTLC